jgi:hypothetical protein
VGGQPLQRRATRFEWGSWGASAGVVGDGDRESGQVTQRRFLCAGGDIDTVLKDSQGSAPAGSGAAPGAGAGRGTVRRCNSGENFSKRLWPLYAMRGLERSRRGPGDSSHPKL